MSRRRRTPGNGPRPNPTADFWGARAEEPRERARIYPTADPGALPRSLGDPPLGSNPAASQHHLAAVYQEAVRAATALAAANGLLGEGDPTGN